MDETRNPNCIFCKIIGGEETVSIIYEDEEIIAFLDIQPLYPGHVLVVPKPHYKNLFFVREARAARTLATPARHPSPDGKSPTPPAPRRGPAQTTESGRADP